MNLADTMVTLLAAVTATLFALQEAPRTQNVLIVGNSLTYYNELPWMLEQIARSKKAQPLLHVEFSGGSGMTLEQHWKQGKAVRRINEAQWDFVVLQAQSSEALRATPAFEEYARRFDAVIRSRHARAVIVETWAPLDAHYSQQAFNAEYEKIARDLGAILAPAGAAWSDLQTRGVDLYDGDAHPNVAGSYLYACVLYSVLYGESASGATHTFDVHFVNVERYRQSLEHDVIDDARAAAIQAAAWAAVRRARG